MRSLIFSLILLGAPLSNVALAHDKDGPRNIINEPDTTYPDQLGRDMSGAGIPGPRLHRHATPAPPYYGGPVAPTSYDENDPYPGELERELAGAGIPGPELEKECWARDRAGNEFPGKTAHRAVKACRAGSQTAGCALVGCN